MNRPLRTAIVAGLLVVLHLPVMFAGFFAPYGYAEQNRELSFAPPTRLHFVDALGTFHFRPFVYDWKQTAASGPYEEDRTRAHAVQLLVRIAVNGETPARAAQLRLFGLGDTGRLFLFGADSFGRDMFSRMLYGGRISLLAGFVGAAVALLLGGTMGIVSGYCGRWVDAVVMRLVDLFLALPWLYLLFAVRAILPLRIKTSDAFLVLIGVVGLIGWARPARLVRGIVLSAKERNFVLAARAMGASRLHILRWHVLPQTYRSMLTMQRCWCRNSSWRKLRFHFWD